MARLRISISRYWSYKTKKMVTYFTIQEKDWAGWWQLYNHNHPIAFRKKKDAKTFIRKYNSLKQSFSRK